MDKVLDMVMGHDDRHPNLYQSDQYDNLGMELDLGMALELEQV